LTIGLFVFFTPNQAQANGVEFINHGAKHYHGIPARWDPGVDFFFTNVFLVKPPEGLFFIVLKIPSNWTPSRDFPFFMCVWVFDRYMRKGGDRWLILKSAVQ
jgi:hypothetical protein